MYSSTGGPYGPSKGIRLNFLTQADQTKFEQLFAQSSAAFGGNKISAETVSDLLRRSNLDNDTLAKIWDLASIANAPYLTFPEFAVAMYLTSRKLMGQTLPNSLPTEIREETEIAMATIASTETAPSPQQQQLLNTSIPPQQTMQTFGNMMGGITPSMTGLSPQVPMTTGIPMQQQRPTPPPLPSRSMMAGYTSNYQSAMQTGFQPSIQPPPLPPKTRLPNQDFAKKMMPNQNGVTNLLNPSLGTTDANRITWKISPEDKMRYREIFNAWEGSGSGFMSGDTAKDVFTQSQLPPEDLMKIWNLADSENRGSLDEDEFAVAMHLIYRKMNGCEIPSVLPAELKPPSSVLKRFVLGRRPPPSKPSFGTSNDSQYGTQNINDDSPYNMDSEDYVSSSRRKGPQSSGSRSYSRYDQESNDEADVEVLEDLRKQITETQRQLDRMPKTTNQYKSSSYSSSSKMSLEELKENIRRAQEDINKNLLNNTNFNKYWENAEKLMGLIETEKSLQDELQYLCNRDIPVLARQLRSAAAELRDAKVRQSRNNDGTKDYMAFIQPTGPGGSITESDRVRAKAKAMMAARKAGASSSSADAGLIMRRAEEEQNEMDKRADSIEREMENSRTALLDLRGDLKYLEELSAAKDLEDKKRFENKQDLSYELRHFLEQLESRAPQRSTASQAQSFRENSPLDAFSGSVTRDAAAPAAPAAPSTPISPSVASPQPKPSTARPRTAEEIKKEAERRVQERLAAIQAKRKPTVSSKPSSNTASPTEQSVSKPNEAEQTAKETPYNNNYVTYNQTAENERKRREEEEAEQLREKARLERERPEEAEQAQRRQDEEEKKRQREEKEEMERRRREVLEKEEAQRQARFDALKREEDEAEALKQANAAPHKPEEQDVSNTDKPGPAQIPEPTRSSTNPFNKLQQDDQSNVSEKPNEAANKRVSYNPFAAFSAFSATKGGNKADTDSDDDNWDAGKDESDEENEYPAAGSAKSLASKLFSVFSGNTDTDASPKESPKPNEIDSSNPTASSDIPLPPPAPPVTTAGDAISTPPPPPPPPAAPAAPPAPEAPASIIHQQPASAGGDLRSVLLSQIQQGTRLKKAVTNDRSSSSVAGRVIGDASTPVQPAPAPAEIAAPTPVPAAGPLASANFLAELQARASGQSTPTQASDPQPFATENSTNDTNKNEAPANTTQPSSAAPENSGVDASTPEKEYVAMWDYSGAGADDLAFSQDDIILVRDDTETEDWWYGTLQKNQKAGYFPRAYVQMKVEVPELNIKVRALYDFTGPTDQGCLDFCAGETLTVLVKENDDWWKARSEDGSREGLVPANYVEEV